MSAVDDYLAAVRSVIHRVTPQQAHDLQQAGALVIDLRPVAYRAAEGEIPGSVPVERIHLEWRLAPDSDARLPQVDPHSIAVVLCNEGYASSLAVRDLYAVGLPNAVDLIGGFRAWAAAGLPVGPGGGPAAGPGGTVDPVVSAEPAEPVEPTAGPGTPDA